jgi:hypothetical protein
VVQPRRRAQDLSSPEEIKLSIEQNVALSIEAKREQEQNAAEAGRIENAVRHFALFQRRVLFGFEIAFTLLCLIALAYFGATEPRSFAVLLSGSGSIAGTISLLLRQRQGDNDA